MLGTQDVNCQVAHLQPVSWLTKDVPDKILYWRAKVRAPASAQEQPSNVSPLLYGSLITGQGAAKLSVETCMFFKGICWAEHCVLSVGGGPSRRSVQFADASVSPVLC